LQARGSAAVLNFSCGIILFTVCRNIITLLRSTFLNRFIPFDKNITFHKAIAWTIALFTALHAGSHYFNFLGIEKGTLARPREGRNTARWSGRLTGSHVHLPRIYFFCAPRWAASPGAKSAAHLPTNADAYTAAVATVAGSTGHLLIITMLLMYGAAMENVRVRFVPTVVRGFRARRISGSPSHYAQPHAAGRSGRSHAQRKYFELFWYSHHLFIVFFILLLAHGAQCLIQPNVAVRPSPRALHT
jgi:hypothetical protein